MVAGKHGPIHIVRNTTLDVAMTTITAAEANRAFSSLQRRASAGETVVVTSRGRPVAQIGPFQDEAAAEALRREAAKSALLEHLRTVKPQIVGPRTREELYEREPKGAD